MSQDLSKPGGTRKFNTNEAVDSGHLIEIGTMAEQSLWEGLAAGLFNGRDGFIGIGCRPAKGAGDLDWTVDAGMGVITLAGGAKEPSFTPIFVDVQQAGTFTAHDPAFPRIDIISLAPLDVDDEQISIRVLSGNTIDPVPLFSRTRRSFQLTVTPGTPAAGPVAPATPAGHLLVGQFSIPAMVGPIFAVADSRQITGAFNPRRCRLVATAISAEAANVIDVTLQLEDTDGNLIPEARRFIATAFDDAGTVDSAILRINGAGVGLVQSQTGRARVVFDTSTATSPGTATLSVEDVSASITSQAWLEIEMVEGYSPLATPIIEPVNSTIGFKTLVRLDFN